MLSFATTPRHPEDFREQFLDCQTNPNSMFTQKRICSKLTSDGRVSLSDDHLTVTVEGQKRKSRFFQRKIGIANYISTSELQS